MFSTREVDAFPVRTVAKLSWTTSRVFIIFSSISSRTDCSVMAPSLKTVEMTFNHQLHKSDQGRTRSEIAFHRPMKERDLRARSDLVPCAVSAEMGTGWHHPPTGAFSGANRATACRSSSIESGLLRIRSI